MAIQIAPSILTCDFAHLRDELARIGSADWVHVDVMDNHFVPNLTLGPVIVEAVARSTELPIDCHLMIADPDRWAPGYVEAGARSVTVHAEAVAAPVRLARQLRAQGARAGIAFKPATPVEPYLGLLAEFDMVLVMTVEPGFGGQSFLDSCLPKVRRVREAIAARGGDVWLQVDGGVAEATIEACAAAGADVFVAGSAVYNAQDSAASIATLRALAAGACVHWPQLPGVVERHYRGVRAALVLLVVDPSRLDVEVRVENGYPHLYGALPVDAVSAVLPISSADTDDALPLLPT